MPAGRDPTPRTRLSAPTNTMLRAIAGSMICGGGFTTLSAASESVMLCPTVKAVTIFTSCFHVPPSRSSPTRNRMWSGPIMMWWMPDGMNVCITAIAPCVLPE